LSRRLAEVNFKIIIFYHIFGCFFRRFYLQTDLSLFLKAKGPQIYQGIIRLNVQGFFWHLNKVKGKLNWPFVLDIILNTKISEI